MNPEPGMPPPDDDESEPDTMPVLEGPFDDSQDNRSDVHHPQWLCRDCRCPDWRRMDEGYRCVRCGCNRFFDAAMSSGDSWGYSGTGNEADSEDPGDSWDYGMAGSTRDSFP